MKNYRSSLSKARGAGAARSGTKHFLWQRMTSLMLIPLLVWFVFFVINITRTPLEDIYVIIMSPVSIIGVMTLLLVASAHAVMGMKVIIEDYIHHDMLKFFMLFILYFVVLISVIAGFIALINMHNVVRASALLSM